MNDTPRACSTCLFSVLVQTNPQVLSRTRFCFRFPPAVILVPSVKNMAGQVQVEVRAQHPVVVDSDWCYEHKSPDELLNQVAPVAANE